MDADVVRLAGEVGRVRGVVRPGVRDHGRAIADGVEAYRGLALYRRPPKMVADYKADLVPGNLSDVEEPSSTFPASEWVPTSMRTMPMPRLD